ncbi:MAG: hypothetical protein AAF645_21700 [Myxococcota bacterium]
MQQALLTLLLMVACAAPPNAGPSGAEPANAALAAEPSALYSPFVVELESTSSEPMPFSRISFKDVGMSIDPADRTYEYELLAERVAEAMGQRFASFSHVRHAPEGSEPSNHMACEGGHIYVDLWSVNEGVGYSLWSGCGEDARFAMREVSPVSGVAVDIAEQLRVAARTGCFTAHC